MFQVKKGAYIALIVGSILYGMTGLFLFQIHDMSITSIIFYRLFFGLLAISVFIVISNSQSELKIAKKKFLLLLQVIFGLISLIFYFICIEKTCFSIAVLLQSTAPICVMLASPYLLKEKVGKESILALIIAITGVYLVIHPDRGFVGFDLSGSYYVGIVSGLLSGLFSAFCIINIRILKRNYSEFSIAFWTTALCCLLMSPYAFEPSLNIITTNIFPLLASGILIVGIGGILTTIGFANLKSQTGSLLSLIQLVAGVFFDLAVLKVTLPADAIEGCILVLIASVIISLNDSSKLSIIVNAYVKIVGDYCKSLMKVRRWGMSLQMLTIRSKK
ncbi:MAG: hypothetical protein QG646_2067 [Euryarchaeota archaeon]|nr:hypothetical protein [Euryarchaeota archaeon]